MPPARVPNSALQINSFQYSIVFKKVTSWPSLFFCVWCVTLVFVSGMQAGHVDLLLPVVAAGHARRGPPGAGATFAPPPPQPLLYGTCAERHGGGGGRGGDATGPIPAALGCATHGTNICGFRLCAVFGCVTLGPISAVFDCARGGPYGGHDGRWRPGGRRAQADRGRGPGDMHKHPQLLCRPDGPDARYNCLKQLLYTHVVFTSRLFVETCWPMGCS
jgi:hypothetical protein